MVYIKRSLTSYCREKNELNLPLPPQPIFLPATSKKFKSAGQEKGLHYVETITDLHVLCTGLSPWGVFLPPRRKVLAPDCWPRGLYFGGLHGEDIHRERKYS